MPTPDPPAPPAPHDYRLSPALAARVLGLCLVGIALLVLLTTVLAAVLDLHTGVVLAAAFVGLLLVGVLGAAVTRAAYVVRLTAEGYRVRLVRGAGVSSARWEDVEDVVTARVAGADCVVVRLGNGRSTTIPVTALAGDRDDFVRDVRSRLPRRRA